MERMETTVAGFPGWTVRASGRRVGRAVFVHGAFGDHTVFGSWLGRFAQAGWDGWALSRRGRHGVPPADAVGVTIADYLADVRAVLAALPTDGPLLLVGHSLGGLLAQVLAAEGRCDALALVATAPPGMLTAQLVALPVFAPILPRILLGRPFTVPAGGCRRVALNGVPDAEDRRRIHATLVAESGLVYRAMMAGSVRVDPRRVRCPVLVVAGGQDRIVSTRLARGTARHFGAELAIYPDRGHWIPEEPGWEQVADDILTFAQAAVSPGRRSATA